MVGPEISTDRLLLRQWRGDDLAPFTALNGDRAVMQFFPAVLTPDESAALVSRINACFAERGYGLWAVEVKEDGCFAGFVGLSPAEPSLPFAPAVEVGWRLARRFWGCGYATEAARASLAFGFDQLGLREIVSFTAVVNHRSQRVMERIGMTRDRREDFAHPGIAPDSPLRPHVLYRVSADSPGRWPSSREVSLPDG